MVLILAVEDEPQLLSTLSEELADEDHEVMRATNGLQALERLAERIPDLIISDIAMPGMDGYALLEAVRRDWPQCEETPFLFLTAYAERDAVVRGTDAGVDDYLTKPIDFDRMHAAIADSLRKFERPCAAEGSADAETPTSTAGDPDAEPEHAEPWPASPDPEAVDPDQAPAEVEEALAEVEEAPAEVEEALEKRKVGGAHFQLPKLRSPSGSLAEHGESIGDWVRTHADDLFRNLFTGDDLVELVWDDDGLACMASVSSEMDRERAEGLAATEALCGPELDTLAEALGVNSELLVEAMVVIGTALDDELAGSGLPAFEAGADAASGEVMKIETAEDWTQSVGELVAGVQRLVPLVLLTEGRQRLPLLFFDFDDATSSRIRSMFASRTPDENKRAKADMDTLGLDAVARTLRGVKTGFACAVDVHYDTLQREATRVAFFDAFERVRSEIGKEMIVTMKDLPAGMRAEDLGTALKLLQAHRARGAIQIDPWSASSLVLARQAVACVVCDCKHVQRHLAKDQALHRLRSVIKRKGTIMVLRSVPDPAEIEKFADYGFDGYATRVVRSAARPPSSSPGQ